MNKKYCNGCRDNFYNGNNGFGIDQCWSLKSAKMVWRIPVGFWENPPYKLRKVRVPDCWHGQGSNRTIYVKPESLTRDGYWIR